MADAQTLAAALDPLEAKKKKWYTHVLFPPVVCDAHAQNQACGLCPTARSPGCRGPTRTTR